jgi:hypothetical protein
VDQLRIAFESVLGPVRIGSYNFLYNGNYLLPGDVLPVFSQSDGEIPIIYVVHSRLYAPACRDTGIILSSPHSGAADTFAKICSVNVEVDIHGFVANVCIKQVIRNDTGNPMTAVYRFPMDSSACVYSMVITCGDAVTKAIVMDRSKAQAEYNAAVSAGKGAYMASESGQSEDVYVYNMGNILPATSVEVALSYTTTLTDAGVFALPAKLVQRYVNTPDGAVPWDRWRQEATVPYGSDYPQNIRVTFDRSTVFAVSCGNVVDKTDRLAVVNINGLTEDFVVTSAISEDATPFISCEVDTETDTAAVMITLHPNLDNMPFASRTAMEYWFIMDCSGSMTGPKIVNARNALQACLRSLPAESHFQIVTFGDSFKVLFKDGPVPYGDDSMEEADTFIADMGATMGGTEILSPLVHAFARGSTRPRQIFLFTDGEVSNTRVIVDKCQEEYFANGIRVFTFGIGTTASKALVEGIATATCAGFEIIRNEEDLSAAVVRQLKRSVTNALSSFTVEWGTDLTNRLVFPTSSLQRVMYSGSRALLFGVFHKASTLCDIIGGPITVTACGPDGDLSWPLTISLEYASAGRCLHSMAAKGRIQALEHSPISADVKRAEIVAISTQMNVLSKYTSFLGIEDRPEWVKRLTVSTPAPDFFSTIQTASGYGYARPLRKSKEKKGNTFTTYGSHADTSDEDDYEEDDNYVRRRQRMGKTVSPAVASCGIVQKMKDVFSRKPAPSEKMAGAIASNRKSVPIPDVSSKQQVLNEILAAQKANGCWKHSLKLLQSLLLVDIYKSVASGKMGDADPDEIMTCLVVAFLEQHLSMYEAVWCMVAEKATTWLLKSGIPQADIDIIKSLVFV